MRTNRESIVTVYHDETKCANSGRYKGHIFFFVPKIVTVQTDITLFGQDIVQHGVAGLLLDKIAECRKTYGLTERKLHFSEISGRKWVDQDQGYRAIMEVLVDGLRHKFGEIFDVCLGCKIAVMFYPKKSDVALYGGQGNEQYLRHDETVMRMLLKGALHSVYSDSDRVQIDGMYTDGQPNHRPLDDERVIERLRHEHHYGRKRLRGYIDLNSNVQTIGINSDHMVYAGASPEYAHANFLQMADLLLGAVIRSCYGKRQSGKREPRIGSMLNAGDKKGIISYPVREMLEKAKRGKGFANSGHYKSFYLRSVDFAGEELMFGDVGPTANDVFANTAELDFGL